MSLRASQGAAGPLRATARKASNLLAHSNGPGLSPTTGIINTSRSIHIPAFLKEAAQSAPRSSASTQSITHKLFTHSRNFFSGVFAQLTAPGLRTPSQISNAASRSLMHTSALHRQTIQQGFSNPARIALQSGARGNVYLPRVPPVGRSVAHVGLGTARNFSSSRPLFHDLVDNVPVIGRALCEADLDWDQKMRNEQAKMKKATKGKENVKKGKEMLKPKEFMVIKGIIEDSSKTEPTSEEMEHYFPTVPIAPVTTYLLIPLAPTPFSRLPLASSTDRLLPLPQIASIHATHSTHSLRVSTLFTRLDQAHVWARGVKCSAYGQGKDEEGTCTVLKVEFVGWAAAEVRSVIGESGTGWCVLEEVREDEEFDDALSDVSEDDLLPLPLGAHPTGMVMPETVTIDPAQSFVLPTLDFSSSFVSTSSRTPPEAEFTGLTHYSDPWVSSLSSPSLSSVSSLEDMMSAVDEGWVVPDPPSENGWYSSRVARSQRIGDGLGEPREDIFY